MALLGDRPPDRDSEVFDHWAGQSPLRLSYNGRQLSTVMDRLPGMSAEVFHPSSLCPLCGNPANAAMSARNGHLICPYCQASFVISHHGQFVRDPFRRSPLVSIQQLRRQSRPLARLLRDSQIPLRVIIGGFALLAIGSLTWTSFNRPPDTELAPTQTNSALQP
jgi:hypothetical protein